MRTGMTLGICHTDTEVLLGVLRGALGELRSLPQTPVVAAATASYRTTLEDLIPFLEQAAEDHHFEIALEIVHV